MKVRLAKDTFVRFIEEKAYITNQKTRKDRNYNETGADFLREIGRDVRDVEQIVDKLSILYGSSVSRDKLLSGFITFIEDLHKDMFVVVGNSEDDIENIESGFISKFDSIDSEDDEFSLADNSTQSVFLDEAKFNPRLNGLLLELSSRCNERCIHCYIPEQRKDCGLDMPLEMVKKVIDQFCDMGGLSINLSGGEVFLHKNIIEVIQYCRKKDLQISILSNLIALRDNQIQPLQEANLAAIQTSLYSMNPEVHDKITKVKGSFVKTKAAIEKLRRSNIPVKISCPLMQANKNDYRAVIQYAESVGCQVRTDFIMMAQSNFDTSNLYNRLSLSDIKELLIESLSAESHNHKKMKGVLTPSEARKINEERFLNQSLCGAGIGSLCVAANGDVYPCAGWQSKVCGNVYKSSLQSIWKDSNELAQLRMVTRKDFPQCIDCEAQDYCSMCLVRNYNESNGDMFKVNKHFCDVAFLTKQIYEKNMERQVILKINNTIDEYISGPEALYKIIKRIADNQAKKANPLIDKATCRTAGINLCNTLIKFDWTHFKGDEEIPNNIVVYAEKEGLDCKQVREYCIEIASKIVREHSKLLIKALK